VQLLLQRSVHEGDHDFGSLGRQFDTLFREYTDISLSLRSHDGDEGGDDGRGGREDGGPVANHPRH